MTETKKIEKLTPEQEKLQQEYYEKGLAMGRNTTPIDHEKVKNILSKFYNEINVPVPEFVFCDSPLACERYINEREGNETPKTHSYYAGQLYCSWEIFYAFCRDIGVEYSDKNNRLLDMWLEQSEQCFWWYPFEEACVVSERPLNIRVDDQNRLHCADKPAIDFKDGWELFFWHGVAVPKEWIMDKENVDPSLALTWENTDQRTALAEILGWDRVLKLLNPRVIDKDPDPEIGELIEVDLPDSPGERFLRARCGTGKTICLCVDSSFETALEANAATYGLPLDIFKLKEVRT